MPIKIFVPECELFDPTTEEFYTVKPVTLIMEHSLISVSKWEETWKVPFIEGPNPKSKKKTTTMWNDYYRCMVISPKEVDPKVFSAIPAKERRRIDSYISEQRTASYVSDDGKKGGAGEQITSELIYFWMINYNVPESFEKWHLSRLLMLIRICQRKTATPNKKSTKDKSLEYARISAARRKAAAAKRKT